MKKLVSLILGLVLLYSCASKATSGIVKLDQDILNNNTSIILKKGTRINCNLKETPGISINKPNITCVDNTTQKREIVKSKEIERLYINSIDKVYDYVKHVDYNMWYSKKFTGVKGYVWLPVLAEDENYVYYGYMVTHYSGATSGQKIYYVRKKTEDIAYMVSYLYNEWFYAKRKYTFFNQMLDDKEYADKVAGMCNNGQINLKANVIEELKKILNYEYK